MNPEHSSNQHKVFSHWSVFLKILGGICILFAVYLTIPWEPFGYSSNLDESWNAALNRAFAAELQFGKDFVYTYGPFGFLLAPRCFPETYGDILLGRIFIGLVIGIGLWSIAGHCWKTNPWSTLFLVPFPFFFPNAGMPLDSFFIIPVTLPLVLYFYVNKGKITGTFIFILIASALLGLVKHTYLTLGACFILLITIDEIFHQRRFPVVGMIYVGSVLGFWVLANQSPGNFFLFLKNSSEVIKGYSAAMGMSGPLIEIIFYLVSVGLFLVLMYRATLKHRNPFDFLPIIGLAFIFFVTFKTAFVRHDAHAIHSATSTIPIACLFSAFLFPYVTHFPIGFKKIKTKVPIILISWLFLLVNASLIFHHYTNYGYVHYYSQGIYYIWIAGGSAFRLLSGQTEPRKVCHESAKNIRKANPLPELSGTTDLYPFETAVIFAYDLPYKPRPVIQSFAAYTGSLAELNAAHLRGDDSPETILFSIWSIDNRLPSSDDGLSWPELLTRYKIKNISSNYVILKKRSTPLQFDLVPLKELVVGMEQWIELPEDQMTEAIWMHFDARPTFIGKLTSAVFKLPPLFMEVELADGQLHTYRVIADVAHSGQLLSPLVKDINDFVFLASRGSKVLLRRSEVKRMRLMTKDWGTLAYPQYYLVRLSRLDFPHQDLTQISSWSPYLAVAPILKGKIVKGEVRIINNVLGPNKKPIVFAHADSRIELDFPKGGQKLFLGYGILDDGWQGAMAKSMMADGVEFRVLAINPEGKETVLFSRLLDPYSRERDRGEQKEEIDLGDISPQTIVIESLMGPLNDPSWDWSYWSEFRIEFHEH